MSKPWIGFAALGLALATGCGIKKEVHQKALDRIGVLESDLSAEQKAKADLEGRIANLEGDLTQTRADRDLTAEQRKQREADLARAELEKQATLAELEALRKQQEAAEKRLAAYKALQNRFRQLVDTGKLSVLFRNGQMVLKLPSGILFASGSAELSQTGLAALAEVTTALEEFKNRRFVIAGHTDNVPIRDRRFANNWMLSTARAVSVVLFMIEAGYPAANLAAAGYGEFDPIAPNDTPANKEQNRRIEIILVPNLEELPSLTGEP